MTRSRLRKTVRRLVDETRGYDAVLSAVSAGAADIDAGRYVTVATPEEEQRLHDGMMARLRTRLSAHG